MKKLLAAFVAFLIVGAYAAGYWPQRKRLIAAQTETAELRQQLAGAKAQLEATEAKVRLGQLFGQFLVLRDVVAAGNYGDAQALSSAFFDQVLDGAGKAKDARIRVALEAIMARRDAATAGLTRGDGSIREVLPPIESGLRLALDYPASPVAPPKPQGADNTR